MKTYEKQFGAASARRQRLARLLRTAMDQAADLADKRDNNLETSEGAAVPDDTRTDE